MNEAETRAEHIDPALKEVGWERQIAELVAYKKSLLYQAFTREL